MKPGSLVECIRTCSGVFYVNGKATRLLPDIEKGEIRVVDEIFKEGRRVGLVLAEDGAARHPVTGNTLGRWADCFREIQPPMSIPEELFNYKPENA
jgi:hypothetical protein